MSHTTKPNQEIYLSAILVSKICFGRSLVWINCPDYRCFSTSCGDFSSKGENFQNSRSENQLVLLDRLHCKQPSYSSAKLQLNSFHPSISHYLTECPLCALRIWITNSCCLAGFLRREIIQLLWVAPDHCCVIQLGVRETTAVNDE